MIKLGLVDIPTLVLKNENQWGEKIYVYLRKSLNIIFKWEK